MKDKKFITIILSILLISILFPLISASIVMINKKNSFADKRNRIAEETYSTNEREELIQEFRQLMENVGVKYGSRQEFKEAVLAADGKNIDDASIEELKEMVESAKKTTEKQERFESQFKDIITENEAKYKNMIYDKYFNKKTSYVNNSITSNYKSSSQVYTFNNEEKIKFKMCYCTLDKENSKVVKMAFCFTVYGSASCYNSFTSSYTQGNGEVALDVLFDVKSGLMYQQGAIYGFDGIAIGEQKGDRGFNYGHSLDEISGEDLFAICNYEQSSKFRYYTNNKM